MKFANDVGDSSLFQSPFPIVNISFSPETPALKFATELQTRRK